VSEFFPPQRSADPPKAETAASGKTKGYSTYFNVVMAV